MKQKRMTLEILARMFQNGFKEMAKKVDMDARFDKVDERFDRVEARLDKIETGHSGRIERLEDDMRVVKTKVGIR